MTSMKEVLGAAPSRTSFLDSDHVTMKETGTTTSDVRKAMFSVGSDAYG